jgi:shikimate kinase
MAQSERSDAAAANCPVQPNAIFLVGFMGAGKTTVGRELSRRLGWQFIDLDDRIVASEGRAIADIFSECGEQAFRRAESRALAVVISELQDGLNAVVALGGGAFVQAENADAIRTTRIPVVFLEAPVEELRSRCAPKGATRPLYQDSETFSRLYHARKSSYMQAEFRVNTTAKSIEAVAVEVIMLLGLKTL